LTNLKHDPEIQAENIENALSCNFEKVKNNPGIQNTDTEFKSRIIRKNVINFSAATEKST